MDDLPERIERARWLRSERVTLKVIAGILGVSEATACRWTKGALPPRPTECQVEGCGDGAKVRGYCDKHYERWRQYGDATVTLRAEEDEPLPAAAKRYLAAFERWLREPTELNYGGVST